LSQGPASDQGAYDQEALLAARHWEGTWLSTQDLRKGPPPDNGLEVLYKSASFNDKMLGHGEPVRGGARGQVSFRIVGENRAEGFCRRPPRASRSMLSADGGKQRALSTPMRRVRAGCCDAR
jgi:hypothetical protein